MMAARGTNLAVLGLVLASLLMGHTESTYCEPMNISLCSHMPYTDILMPNLLYHSTQENAQLVLEQYNELIRSNCSDVLVFYLCTMFAPICPWKFSQEKIPPCRGVCERAQAGCEPVMLRYNVSWPAELACNRLPKYERGVCISPEAIVKDPTEPPPVMEKNTTKGYAKGCKCHKSPNTTLSARKAYLENRFYDYAMKIRFVSAKGIKRGPVELKVRVIKVIKQGQVSIKRGSEMTLRNENGCVCPRMIAGRKYVIMGHEDRRLHRLYYNINSLGGRWQKKWNKNLDNWKRVASARKNSKNERRQNRRKRKHRKKSKRRKEKRKQNLHVNDNRRKSRRKHQKNGLSLEDLMS